MPINPVTPEFGKYSAKTEQLWAQLADKIIALTDAGVPPGEAVDIAVSGLGVTTYLRLEIVDKCLTVLSGRGVDIAVSPLGKRNFWLHHNWPGEDLDLSARITKMAKFPLLKEELRIAMKDARGWREAGRALQKADIMKTDIAGYVDDLESAARRLMQGDPQAFQAYRRALRKAERNLARLAQGGAPTMRLKKAVANLVKVSQETSTEALDKAMDRLVRAKGNYNANRIARTEMTKAYAQGTYARIKQDSDVVAIKYSLSDRHPAPDICNLHTGVNAHGLGRGVYPLDSLPSYPFHPHCLCVMSNVYSGTVEARQQAQAEYLQKASETERKAIMGKAGAEAFALNPQRWPELVKGFEGYKHIDALIQP